LKNQIEGLKKLQPMTHVAASFGQARAVGGNQLHRDVRYGIARR